MSHFRDSLPDDATPTARDLTTAVYGEGIAGRYDEAMAEFGTKFANARRKRDELYQRGGARAVAEAAWVPGGPSIEELTEGYERLAEQARKRRQTAA